MNENTFWAIFVVLVIGGVATPFIHLYLVYTCWWHRFRKYRYRVVQSTVMSHYNDTPRTYYVIQKRGWFGWRDNPDIPGYCSWDGRFSLWKTEHYDTLEKAQEQMDRITAVMNVEGQKRVVRS